MKQSSYTAKAYDLHNLLCMIEESEIFTWGGVKEKYVSEGL